MKKVFSNHHEVCHKFNEQTQSEGRASRIFFEGDRIYSYGYHYLMGQFLTPHLIVINDTGYSSSTSKHIDILRDATSDKEQIFVTKAVPQKVAREIRYNYEKMANARKPEIYALEIKRLFEGFIQSSDKLDGVLSVNSFDGSYSVIPWVSLLENNEGTNKEVNTLINQMRGIYEGLNTPKQAEALERLKEQQKQKRAEKKRAELERIAEEKEKFYTYKKDYINRIDFDLLRVSECGEFVETSQRVKIPMQEAQRYYKLLKSGANMRGEKIAQYITKSFDEALNIGCHKIDKQEAERIGNLITNI